MRRYVFKYNGIGPTPDNARKIIGEFPNVNIATEGTNMIVLSGTADNVRKVKAKLTGWLSSPVQRVKVPPISAKLHKIKPI